MKYRGSEKIIKNTILPSTVLFFKKFPFLLYIQSQSLFQAKHYRPKSCSYSIQPS